MCLTRTPISQAIWKANSDYWPVHRYVRGSLQDYDNWASLAGDSSWDAASMKQYMLKHQTLEPIDPSITDRTDYPFVGQHHGTSGPVRTSFNESALPIENDFIKAADHAAGFSKKPVDPWSGDHIGFFYTMGSVARTGPNRGKRSYAARGYYQANEQRPNIKLITEATVSRVILEGQDQEKKATGIEFVSNETRQKYAVKAQREVIISAGTVASPQILELSGIGDPAILSKAGVECKVELPSVGTDLQDHQLVLHGTHLTEGNFTADSIHIPENMAAAQKALIENQSGPLTSIACVQGFFPAKIFLDDDEIEEITKLVKETKVQSEFQRKQLEQMLAQIQSDKSANLQLVVVPACGDPEGVKDQSKLFPPPANPEKPTMCMTTACCLQYGASRGQIHITSSDPFTPPEIDPGYLSHPADVILLAAGLKFLDKLVHAPNLEGKIAKRYYPLEHVDLSDRQARRDAVREWVMSEYHLIGTCAMGHTLDSRLRVKGAKNLRVVDASTFANNVSGNIVSSVYAVAEKAADLIKEDWDYRAPLAKVAT